MEQAAGYQAMFRDLEEWLAEITGFAAVSLQPNAGSQGEYAGPCWSSARYHEARGQGRRNICLIPPRRTAPTRRARPWRDCASCTVAC